MENIKGIESIKGTSKIPDFIPTATLQKQGKQAIREADARKKFLAYIFYICGAAKFSRALLTIPHELVLPVADRRPLVGHLGEL